MTISTYEYTRHSIAFIKAFVLPPEENKESPLQLHKPGFLWLAESMEHFLLLFLHHRHRVFNSHAWQVLFIIHSPDRMEIFLPSSERNKTGGGEQRAKKLKPDN